MKALRKRDLYVLRAAIKGFAQEARDIRKKEIHPSTDVERFNAWNKKRSLGLHARFHTLAYAFMLGKRYDIVEHNRPLYFNGWQTNAAVAEILAICKVYGDYRVRYGSKDLTAETVLHWFKTGENTAFTWDEPRVRSSPMALVSREAKVNNV